MRGRRFGLCCSPWDGSENKRGDKSRDQKPKCGAVHDSGIVPQWERSRNAKIISSEAGIMSELPTRFPRCSGQAGQVPLRPPKEHLWRALDKNAGEMLAGAGGEKFPHKHKHHGQRQTPPVQEEKKKKEGHKHLGEEEQH